MHAALHNLFASAHRIRHASSPTVVPIIPMNRRLSRGLKPPTNDNRAIHPIQSHHGRLAAQWNDLHRLYSHRLGISHTECEIGLYEFTLFESDECAPRTRHCRTTRTLNKDHHNGSLLRFTRQRLSARERTYYSLYEVGLTPARINPWGLPIDTEIIHGARASTQEVYQSVSQGSEVFGVMASLYRSVRATGSGCSSI